MRYGPLGRAEHKIACLRRIAAADLEDHRRLLLVNCVETYLQLRPQEAEEFRTLQAREANQEVRAMELTWADRLRAEGWKSGQEEGRRREREKAVRALRPLLLQVLGERFGPLPPRVSERIEEIDSVERLTRLARRALTARSLEEMRLA